MLPPEEKRVFTVSEVNEYIGFLLEQDDFLHNCSIRGEISSFTKASSGHVYLSLKDGYSQLNCVMFRNYFERCAADYRQGDMVIAKGNFGVYMQRGQYQFQLTHLTKEGKGDIYQRFLMMKEKLQTEGLFDEERKRELPYFPKKIGIVTSLQGAVIHDMIRVFNRKCPHVELIVVPTLVQGDTAPQDICRSIQLLNNIEGIELIIMARGGGSFEELDCFNAESVARTLADSGVPVISAVGHETDYTIADFVADYRAATPTAAAEHAVPDMIEVGSWLESVSDFIKKQLVRNLREMQMAVDDYNYNLEICMKKNLVAAKKDFLLASRNIKARPILNKLADLEKTLQLAANEKIKASQSELHHLEEKMQLLDVRKVLNRGFSITLHNGKIIKEQEDVENGADIETVLAKGKLVSTVKKNKYGKDIQF